MNNTLGREREDKSRKRLSIIVITFYIIAITIFIVPNENSIQTVRGATIYVPTDYPTIQEAINNAKNGDTVYVYSGTYYENVVVNRSLNLIGENRDITIINGDGFEDVIRITEDWVNITAFTVTFSGLGPFCAGLKIESDYNNISGNNVSKNGVGICLQYSVGNNITANTMMENGIVILGDKIKHWNTHNIDTSNTVYGKPVYYWKNQTGGTIPPGAGQVILANCTNVIVENQRLTNGSVGIELGFSFNNNITGNSVSSNKIYEVFLCYSNNNNLTDNVISESVGYGIYLESSIMNDITSNRVSLTDYAVRLNRSSNNNVTDNTLSPQNKAGILLDRSEGNYIVRNIASSNTDIGIRLISSRKNTIKNNTCSSNAVDGVRLYLSNLNTIENNTLNSNGHCGIQLFGYCDENNIINNIASNNNRDGINFIASCVNNIVNNIVFSNLRSGIYIKTQSLDNILKGNNITSNDDHGIYLKDSCFNKIIHNNISSTNYEGIYLWHSSDNDLIKNNISNNERGISLSALSNNNIITDNQISSNKYDGILFESSLDNKITDNNISDNLEGVNVTSSSDNNIISGNQVSNKGHGIRFSSSSYNTLTGNNVSSNNLDGLRLLSSSNRNSIIGNTVFSNNNYGIYINGSSNNSIYHNNILDNINQAYDDTNNGNQWDNGYPSGGNYWSDFDEPSEGAYDDFNGPDQNVLSGDGIVDKGFGGGGGKNPYVIDPDSQDNYPLMGPYKNYMILKQGWNLISIPQIQQDQNLTKVLASIDGLYDAVQWCDITDKNDPWKHYRPGKPYGNDLFKIKETMGFWIHIIPPGDTIFYYNGVKPAQNQKITLHPGWNMVGYPSLSNKIRTAALNNINFGSDVDSIWTHNAATQKWEEIGPSDYFEIGRGYWIHSKVTKIWDVPI